MKILNGTGKYKKFIGLVCPYGVNYKKNYAWLKAKCKIEFEEEEQFKCFTKK